MGEDGTFIIAHRPTEANFYSIGLPTEAFVSRKPPHKESNFIWSEANFHILFCSTVLYLIRLGFYQSIEIISAVYGYTILSENRFLTFDSYIESKIPVSIKNIESKSA